MLFSAIKRGILSTMGMMSEISFEAILRLISIRIKGAIPKNFLKNSYRIPRLMRI